MDVEHAQLESGGSSGPKSSEGGTRILNQATTILTLTVGIKRYRCARNGPKGDWCRKEDSNKPAK